MKERFLLLFFFSYVICFSQTQKVIPFNTEDRVCFVGNSITHNGEFLNNVFLFHITRFPDQPVTVFNCGIAGDVTNGVLNRMDNDILIHKPTVIVLMLGMNDVQRSLYGEKVTSNIDTLEKRQEALSVYKQNMEKIINAFLSKGIDVILEKPTIYDQTSVGERRIHFGVNNALKIYADFITEIAGKYQLPVVDYWTIMNQLNIEMQENDPFASITGKDRVHPGSVGHFVMGYQFLKELGAPQYISKICIKSNLKKSSENSQNCKISRLHRTKNKVNFSVKEKSLPFPVVPNQEDALKLVPFNQEFNVEKLVVGGLSGKYSLHIDSVFIGVFSGKQLNDGINLAEYKNTPQFQQALNVRKTLIKLWTNEAKLRGIKYIEYNRHFKKLQQTYKTVSKQSLDSIFGINCPNSLTFHLSKSKQYYKNKPLEKYMIFQQVQLHKEAYSKAIPIEHKYEIKLVSE